MGLVRTQLDASVANVSQNAYNITLGSWGRSFSSPGSVTSLTGSTTVSRSMDG